MKRDTIAIDSSGYGCQIDHRREGWSFTCGWATIKYIQRSLSMTINIRGVAVVSKDEIVVTVAVQVAYCCKIGSCTKSEAHHFAISCNDEAFLPST